jgi:hypothetical protein
MKASRVEFKAEGSSNTSDVHSHRSPTLDHRSDDEESEEESSEEEDDHSEALPDADEIKRLSGYKRTRQLTRRDAIAPDRNMARDVDMAVRRHTIKSK